MHVKQEEAVNLLKLVEGINDYTNFIVSEVNDHVLRIAVIDGEFHWHQHETCDELFFVLEGELLIDLEDDRTIRLSPGDMYKVPAKTMHRTRSTMRTVNVCFEKRTNEIDGD